MDGILNVNKPQGKTSFDMVALVKRLSGERRVGHAGTLDPMATGVLPICLGQGTRVTEFLYDASKTYRAEIEFGITTDTYDAWGKVLERKDPKGIKREDVLSTLARFQGEIQQTPPMYSAVKRNGKPLYRLARAGITVERKTRTARIYSIKLIDWQSPVATVDVVCGKGTYIRSLANDLGQALGCGAMLKSLVRLRYGPFDIREALTLPELEDAFRYGYWTDFAFPIDYVLTAIPAVVVGEETARDIRYGASVSLNFEGKPGEKRCRAYTADGCFLGVLSFNPESGLWEPKKVFTSPGNNSI